MIVLAVVNFLTIASGHAEVSTEVRTCAHSKMLMACNLNLGSYGTWVRYVGSYCNLFGSAGQKCIAYY